MTSYPPEYRTFSPWFSPHVFVSFIEKKSLIKFYDVCYHFSWTYKVAKFWMIKLYLNISVVIQTNQHTKHANCDLNVNFWDFLLMSFCFLVKKDHFKQESFYVVCLQVPFKLLVGYCQVNFGSLPMKQLH